MSGIRRLGDSAEERAATFLMEKGYTIVTRNFSCRVGELDLVALDQKVLVFVEVKFRSRNLPEDALNPTKARRWRRAAKAYLIAMDAGDMPYRFDLIAIERDVIRHHIDVLRNE